MRRPIWTKKTLRYEGLLFMGYGDSFRARKKEHFREKGSRASIGLAVFLEPVAYSQEVVLESALGDDLPVKKGRTDSKAPGTGIPYFRNSLV